jgi:hypothetical protein
VTANEVIANATGIETANETASEDASENEVSVSFDGAEALRLREAVDT